MSNWKDFVLGKASVQYIGLSIMVLGFVLALQNPPPYTGPYVLLPTWLLSYYKRTLLCFGIMLIGLVLLGLGSTRRKQKTTGFVIENQTSRAERSA